MMDEYSSGMIRATLTAVPRRFAVMCVWAAVALAAAAWTRVRRDA